MTFAEYFTRVPISKRCMLIWGDADTLHSPWTDARVADAHMMRDLSDGVGYWVLGGSHALVVDSVLTLYDLTAGMLCSDASSASGDSETTGANTNMRLAALCGVIERLCGATRKPTRSMTAEPLSADVRIRSRL